MKTYDYTAPNYYFITICTWEKQHLFGKAGHQNPCGQIAWDGIQQIPCHFSQVSVEKIWQSSFHDHVIRSQRSYERIWLHIHANLDNWEKDCFYAEKQTGSAGS